MLHFASSSGSEKILPGYLPFLQIRNFYAKYSCIDVQPWQLSSRNEFYKSIWGSLSPSKQFPPILMYLDQRPSHCRKHSLNSFCVSAFSTCIVTCSISSMLPQWTFFNAFLTFGNAQNSPGAISGEYGECNTWVVPFFANQSATTCDVCRNALLWWST